MNGGRYHIEIRAVVHVQVSASGERKEVGKLKHSSVARLGKIRDVNEVPKIPTSRSIPCELPHQFANLSVSSRTVHDQKALVGVAGLELHDKKPIE